MRFEPIDLRCRRLDRYPYAPTQSPMCREELDRAVRLPPKKATIALASFLALAWPAFADDRPSIVVYVLDDVGMQLGRASASLEALVAEGVRFEATTPAPLCAPSRASILTGLHVHNHGVRGNLHGAEAWAANGEGKMVADWFLAAGYTTARFGRWINDVPRSPVGWSRVFAPQRRLGDPGGVVDLTARAVDYVGTTAGPLFVYFAPGHDWQNPEPAYLGTHAGVALPMPPSFNERNVNDKRWKVRPLLTPEEVAEITERHRRSLETMESIVDSIRALRAAFGTRPVYVFVVSDNGHQDGQHRYGNGKGQHFDESIRVPLFVLGPGLTPATSPALVYPLDIAPTAAELAGVSTPELDGRSFVPLLTDPGAPWRERVLLEHGFIGIRTPRHKLAVRRGERELYRLKKDPFELRNRCGWKDTVCGSALVPLLIELTGCRGAACWAAETRPIGSE